MTKLDFFFSPIDNRAHLGFPSSWGFCLFSCLFAQRLLASVWCSSCSVFFFFGIKERADQELPRGFWPGEVWSLLIASSRCPSPLHHLLNMPHSLYLFYVVLIFLGKNTLNHIAIHLMPPIPLFHFPHSPTDSRSLNKQHATLVIIPSKSTAGKC